MQLPGRSVFSNLVSVLPEIWPPAIARKALASHSFSKSYDFSKLLLPTQPRFNFYVDFIYESINK